MLVVAALSLHALLRRGEAPTADNLQRSVAEAAAAIAPVAARHQLVITFAGAPAGARVALQAAEHSTFEGYPSEPLTFRTEELVTYFLEQELANLLPDDRSVATLLTMAEVDPADPAFQRPATPVGPLYLREESEDLIVRRGWTFRPEGDKCRRVVASPEPVRVVELRSLARLLQQNVVVLAKGGGGLAAVRGGQRRFSAADCAIDADLVAGVLARDLGADRFILLTRSDFIYVDCGRLSERQLLLASPAALLTLTVDRSMAGKVNAACRFVAATGRTATIGAVHDLPRLLSGDAGTTITADANGATFTEPVLRGRPPLPLASGESSSRYVITDALRDPVAARVVH